MAFDAKVEATDVMLVAIVIVTLIIAISFAILWIFTKDVYLDLYFLLDSFFDAQNTAASSSLAELAFSSDIYKLAIIFAIVVVDNLSRILVTSFIIAAVIDILNYANIEELLNEFRAKFFGNHIIVCDYNGLAEELMQKLRNKGIKYLFIVNSTEKAAKLSARHIPNLSLDFTEEKSLVLAGIKNAKAIVFASESDVDNTLGALVARKLNPNIRILLRLKDEHSRKKAYIAGADMAVIPEHLAGLEMGEFIIKGIKAGT